MNTNLETLSLRYNHFSSFLNEKQRRIFLGIEAKLIGHGGISAVAKITKSSRRAVSRGISESNNSSDFKFDRIRKPGGGRKKTIDKDPTLIFDLDKLIDPITRGDPESPLRWTCKSVRKLADCLKELGHKTSHKMVAELLHDMNYSLQANKKVKEGSSHVDRNAQFEYINNKVKEFHSKGSPVISVDSKKKENIGEFKNNGKEWQLKGKPEEVNVYDFIDKDKGKVTPYGVYDIGKNLGWVNVGTDKDTAEFAVESIRKWWYKMGKELYPSAKRILINADGGGSNSSRSRLWKTELQKLANELNLEINVSHFPPGTSKWNKIEHRLFSHISMNWRGKPLVSHEVVVNYIASTTTKQGLKVSCEIDNNKYEKGIKITDKQLGEVNIRRSTFHGEWNYAIIPIKNETVIS